MPLSGNLRSIVFMLCTVAMFSCMDAMLKVLSGAYPAAQVTAMRGWASMPLVCLYIAWRGEFNLVFSARLRWRLHLLRAVFGIMTMVLFVVGLKTMGLAEAYTLSFVAPMVITLLAVPMLRERVFPRHWFAITAGLVGVVVALRPNHSGFLTVGALAVLAAAVTYATGSVLGRIISRTDPAVSLVFWSTASLAVGGSLLNCGYWRDVRPENLQVLLGVAVTGFLAQVAISEAFRHGQASAVAPFEYSALAWAIALDWLFWHAVPDLYTLTGAAIIIASGIYLIRRESPGRVPVVLPP
ncbi:MAG: DMT family transporter [Rhodoferax sp.]|nr:DMT family transporter [Rhodoferax sp.]